MFISQSVEAVIQTMFEAVILVVVVIILFLQTWRASIVPIVAIPVSLIGTFAMLSALGYSLNNLSLFGLLLAIGIVVDDAIVVVENVERNIREGLSPRDAAYKTMEEVGGALIAIALVLTAVFIPSVFLTGILGQFFRQFAVTIATSTVISLIVSLTLSPALCALLFKPHVSHPERQNIFVRPINAFFRGFNRAFEWLSSRYGALTGRLVRVSLIMVILYAGLIGLTVFEFSRAPTGFIPQQDQGYLINIIQLPPGASLARTDEVARRVNKLVLDTPGVAHTVPIVGLDGATFTNAPNAAVIFTPLAPFDERAKEGLTAQVISINLNKQFAAIQDGLIISVSPPPVRGIGTTGGFKLEIQDTHGGDLVQLEGRRAIGHGRGQPDAGADQCLHHLQHPHAEDLGRYRPRPRRDARGQDRRRVHHARSLSRLAICERFQFPRPHLPGHGAGRRPVPPGSARHLAAEDAQRQRPDGAARLGRRLQQHHRTLSRRALQSVPVRRRARRHAARLFHRLRPRRHGQDCGAAPAGRLRSGLDRDRLSGAARRQHRHLRVRRLGGVRVPVARGAI